MYIQDQHHKEINFEEHHCIPLFVVFQFLNDKYTPNYIKLHNAQIIFSILYGDIS